MFKITLSPQRRDDTLEVSVDGERLIINGQIFDFATLPDGVTVPAAEISHPFIIGDVNKVDGAIEITLILPLGIRASESQKFPEVIEVSTSGPVALPEPDPEPEDGDLET